MTQRQFGIGAILALIVLILWLWWRVAQASIYALPVLGPLVGGALGGLWGFMFVNWLGRRQGWPSS